MPLETQFSLAGMAAMAGWLLLIFLPRVRIAHLIAGVVIPLAIAVLYLTLILQYFGRGPGGFGSLADVSLLFSQPGPLLAGWVHYLAFDLFIGAWEVRDAQRNQVHHLLVVPCLVMTFMLGPIGLLSYFVVRAIKMRRLDVSVTC
jgi:hypothetical protein